MDIAGLSCAQEHRHVLARHWGRIRAELKIEAQSWGFTVAIGSFGTTHLAYTARTSSLVPTPFVLLRERSRTIHLSTLMTSLYHRRGSWFTVTNARIPKAARLTIRGYCDRRIAMASGPKKTLGISREWLAPSRSVRVSTAARCPNNCLGRIIRTSSNPGEIVLDPFSGSSTTVAVAKKLQRRYLSFEMSGEYHKLGTARWRLRRRGMHWRERQSQSIGAQHAGWPTTGGNRYEKKAKKGCSKRFIAWFGRLRALSA